MACLWQVDIAGAVMLTATRRPYSLTVVDLGDKYARRQIAKDVGQHLLRTTLICSDETQLIKCEGSHNPTRTAISDTFIRW